MEEVNDVKGVIYYKFKIPVYINTKENVVLNVEDILYKEVLRVLSLLPRGTKHLGTEEAQVIDLNLRYLMKFQNDIFVDGAELIDTMLIDTISYHRGLGFKANGEIVAFNGNNCFNYSDFIKSERS